jgi:hypothetical protein
LVKKLEGVIGESKAAMAKPESVGPPKAESAKVNTSSKDGF